MLVPWYYHHYRLHLPRQCWLFTSPQMVDAPHPDQTESVRQQLLQTPSPSLLPQFLPITTTGGSCDPCKWLSRQPPNCRATRLADKEKGEDRDRVRAASIFPEVWRGEGCWTKPKNMIKNEEVMSKTLKKDYYGSFWSVLILWPFLVQFIHFGMVTISGSTLGLKGIFFWLNPIVVGF